MVQNVCICHCILLLIAKKRATNMSDVVQFSAKFAVMRGEIPDDAFPFLKISFVVVVVRKGEEVRTLLKVISCSSYKFFS